MWCRCGFHHTVNKSLQEGLTKVNHVITVPSCLRILFQSTFQYLLDNFPHFCSWGNPKFREFKWLALGLERISYQQKWTEPNWSALSFKCWGSLCKLMIGAWNRKFMLFSHQCFMSMPTGYVINLVLSSCLNKQQISKQDISWVLAMC